MTPPLAPRRIHGRGTQEPPRNRDEAVATFAADPLASKTLVRSLRDEFIAHKSEKWRQYHQRGNA